MQKNLIQEKFSLNRIPHKYSDNFVNTLIFFYAAIPLVDIASGALFTYFEIDGFSIAYKAGVIPIFILLSISRQIRKEYLLLNMIIIILLIAGAAGRSSLGAGGFFDDMLYIARGPIFLGTITIILFSLSRPHVERIANVYFISTWVAIFTSIIGASFFGLSLSSYGSGYGLKGFYQSANEVTFSFVLSWWFIQVRFGKRMIPSAILLSMTCFLLYQIGTKSGFVCIAMLGTWYIFSFLRLNRYTSFGIFFTIAFVVYSFAEDIYLALLPYLPGSDVTTFFITRYGVSTTLTGGRFVDLDLILSVLGQYSVGEIIFGAGFNNFWFSIDGNSVESDLIDILGGGGVIFAGWFYGLLIWGYINSNSRATDGRVIDSAWSFVFITVFIYSVFAGHVAFAATPLISLSIYLALSHKEQTSENTNRSIMV